MANWDSTSAHSHKSWNDRNRMRKWLLTFFLPKATACALRLLVFHASFSKPGEIILHMFLPSHLPYFCLQVQRPPFPPYLLPFISWGYQPLAEQKSKLSCLSALFVCWGSFKAKRTAGQIVAPAVKCSHRAKLKENVAVRRFEYKMRLPSVFLYKQASKHLPPDDVAAQSQLRRALSPPQTTWQTGTSHFFPVGRPHWWSSSSSLWCPREGTHELGEQRQPWKAEVWCWAPLLWTWCWSSDHQGKASS